MDNKTIKILTADKEDYEIDINKLKEFMSITENSNLPLYFKTSIKNVINSEIQTLQFYFDEVSNDLKNIRISVDRVTPEFDALTPEQQNYLIESGIERIREERIDEIEEEKEARANLMMKYDEVRIED